MKRAHRLNPIQMTGSRATVTGRDGVSAVRRRRYDCAPSAAADDAMGQQRRFRPWAVRSGLPSTPKMAGRRPNRRDGPCVDGSRLARRNLTSQHWSEQPCVRPTCAVHMTAGHNALRGSGPGQYLAFDDAMAHVGCPDRRIDRHCITCCSPSQPLRHAGLSRVISFTPREGRVACSVRSGPSSPKPSGRVCWRVR